MRFRWNTLTLGLLALAALLPIGLLSIYALRIGSESVQELVQANNASAAVITAELVSRDLERGVSLAKAFAALPGMADEMARHDEEAVRARLKVAVESFPRVDRVFVTDAQGVLWSDYPKAPESLGKDFSHRQWYQALSQKWEPIVSDVYQRAAPPQPLVVAIAAPVRGPRRNVIGAIVYQYRLDVIAEWFKKISLGNSGHVFVLDPSGTLAAHPNLDLQARKYNEYAYVEPIAQALKGRVTTTEYIDPIRNSKMVATFLPVMVRGRPWVVVAEQPAREAYAPIHDMVIQIAIASGILAVGAVGVVMFLGRASERNRRLNRQLRVQNDQLRRFESLVHFSNDAIIGTTLDGTIIDWNRAAEDIYGYSAKEAAGQPISFLLPKDRPTQLPQIIEKIQRGENVMHYETVLVRKSGRRIDVSLTISPIKDDFGRVSGASAIARDISERKRAEASLARERFLVDTLMDNIPDHIYFKDRTSHFIRVNAAMAAIFKLQDPSEVVGKSDFDFFLPEHAQRAFEDEQRIIETGQPLVNREEKETWPDGSITWVSTTKQCLRDEKGEVIGTFGISRDITDQKRAELALDEKAKELARSNQELEQFAYAASHDLQEPLRMIASYTQLLARRYRERLDKDAEEFIDFAVDGATRMQVLINDLLAYSRLGTRGKPFAPTDCNEVLRRVLINLKVAIEESGAVVKHDALPTVMADATQLTQLLQNLVGNAIKFHQPGQPPQIDVSARPGNHEGASEWIFSVRDRGIGIEPQYFERIFVIFQRLHGREQYPGTGIGLALCKKIVERHGGRIWVESEPGHGTTFNFTIPLRAETEP